MAAKIKLNDTIQDVIVKMSEGNPGAMTVCMGLLQEGRRIDPDGVTGGLGLVLHLDGLGLYGSRIWMLYKDVCGHDLTKMCAVLRGWQLGQLGADVIRHAVEN